MINIIAQDDSGARLALRLHGKVTRDDYAAMKGDLEKRIAEHGTLMLLVDTSEWESMEPGVVWDDFKFGLENWNAFSRFAILGDQSWIDWIEEIAVAFSSAEVRRFGLEERDAAYAWIGLEPPVPSPRDTQ